MANVSGFELSHLQALAAVVDHGTFDRAATHLHITASAVSQRIKSLEQSVGQVLVQRSKPVVATPAGTAYVRLARQVDALIGDVRAELQPERGHAALTLGVNADTMATWLLPALARLPDWITVELRRDDQANTLAMLQAGTVAGVITSEAKPVQGCRSTPLGTMRYRPVASPDFADRWFSGGATPSALAAAPVVNFDRHDRIQDDYLIARGIDPRSVRSHYVPSSADYVRAIELGMGWGLLPRQQIESADAGQIEVFDVDYFGDLHLFWQQWNYQTRALALVEATIVRAAVEQLDTVHPSRMRTQ
jgi:LysR family transcriptional regulator (chromosome initiation inhibitor)